MGRSWQWAPACAAVALVGLGSIARADLVVSEVYVNPISTTDDDEFIELVNIGPGPIDLSAYALGTNDAPGVSTEVFRRLPAVTLPTEGVAVVVKNGTEFAALWSPPAGTPVIAFSDATGDQLTMGASVAGWAPTGALAIALSNPGNEILLARDEGGDVWSLVDGVIWGSSTVTTMTPLGGSPTEVIDQALTVISGSSLARKSANLDTDQASDWRQSSPATPGFAPLAICGAGVVGDGEGCDDGGEADDDGCSALCQIECGWTCAGAGPGSCATDCGDGDLAGDEACDDGNDLPGDGCSPACTIEPGFVCDDPAPACDAAPETTSACAVDPCSLPLRVTEVHVDGLVDNASEWIELTNAGLVTIDLSAWTVTDQATQGASGEAAATFPDGATLAPGATIVLAHTSETLGSDFGELADYEYGADSDPGVPQLVASEWAPGGTVIQLGNNGDELMLTCGGVVHERLAWGPAPDALTLPAPSPAYDAGSPGNGPATFTRVGLDVASGTASDFVVSRCPTPGVAIDPNRAPDAGPALVTVPAGVTSTLWLPGDDPDGDALVYALASAPALGSATLVSASTGELAYTPPAGPGPFVTSLSYTVADACARSAPVVIQVRVEAAICDPKLVDLRVNEVHVDAAVDNAGEWIEIVNPGLSSTSLTNLRVGDEESPGGSEGMFVFPAGASIGPGQAIVVAFSAVAFEAAWGFAPDWEWNRDSDGVPNDLLRASTWAGGTARLDNAGDEVVLVGCDGTIIDAVYWGVAADDEAPVEAPWATRLPAPPTFTAAPGQAPTSFERTAPDLDSDSAADWALQGCPSPGSPTPEDAPPVAGAGRFAVTGPTFEGALPASDADDDPLTFTVAAPAVGTLTLDDAATGAFTYAPPVGFSGLLDFTFTVSDGCRTDEGTVTLCVGTSELVGDDVDEDCDGLVSCYVDADGDGFGTSAVTTTPIAEDACLAAGRAAVAGDCDDDPGACGAACNPDAREDCNGEDDDCDAGTPDGAGDPGLAAACDSDDDDGCDDDARACVGATLACVDLGPARVEVCDALATDEDCDGGADDLDPQGVPSNATTFFRDRDEDGYGDDALTTVACHAPSGYVPVGGDCADDPVGCAEACSPAITESRTSGNCADGLDNDCDGPADTDPACFADVTCHADADGDGFGASATTVTLTGSDAGAGCAAYDDGVHPVGYWVALGGDCADDPAACGAACAPGRPEVCDGYDNDCVAGTADGSGDVRVGAPCDSPADPDLCQDEVGACAGGAFACPNVAVGDAGRIEVCDALDIDEDCDGGADDADPQGTPGTGTRTVYRDDDGDGRGRSGATLVRCDVPAGYAATGGDCDDDPGACGAACRPGLDESRGAGNCADGHDNDCDLAFDDDPECFGDVLCYLDLDDDGYGAFASERLVTGPAADLGCAAYDDGVHPVGTWVGNGLDCADDPAGCGDACHPGGVEVCDTYDNDCQVGTADGAGDARVGVACDATADADLCADDRQACQDGLVLCVNVTTGDAARVERCDPAQVDEDCDGGADDQDPQGAPADAPLWYRDDDQDGFGVTASAVRRCVAPAMHAAQGGDCADAPAGCGSACRPGGVELCDGFDNDCLSGTLDGSADPAVGSACDAPTDQDRCEDETSVCQGGSVTCPNDPEGDLGRIEVCDPADVDEDCDGGADDDDPEGAGGTTIFRRDRDGDGHGDPDQLVPGCDAGEGRVTSADDCDDDPAACGAACSPEVVEGAAQGNCADDHDNDCDGATDEAEACTSDVVCFADSDGDGWGDDALTRTLPVGLDACPSWDDGDHPVGYWVARGGDCAPGDRDVHPEADEVVGDAIDDDCDGALACWVDADDDEYARDDAVVADAAPGTSCRDAFGLASDRGDCDDDPVGCGAACSPVALEVCDQEDNDCDGDTDEVEACAPIAEPPEVTFVLDGGSGCAGAGDPAAWWWLVLAFLVGARVRSRPGRSGMKHLVIGVAALGTLAAGTSAGRAEDWDDPQYEAPDEDWAWEDGDVLEDGRVEEGLYRPRERSGYMWVPGHYDGGRWVPGDYRPVVRERQGWIWEPGFRGPDGYFVVGFWRPVVRPGWTWVPAGRGRHGYWRPLATRPDVVWVDGSWTPDGLWIDGYWRDRGRVGHTWVPGHWQWGRWIPGHWRPTRKKHGHVWVGGYWSDGRWVDGYWRPARRDGHWWRPARWGPDGRWIQGEWVSGRRIERAHARPRPVAHMVKERAKHRGLWRAGVRQELRGKALEHRGKKVERRGERRDDPRMERRGERMQDRGERKQERGRQKQDRARGR
ncbi:MAG: lamin tail domain-containing protein [Deltaproteobacteria bacterium]|nr:lamin tail domain-containing protein [Deltaproteobacteria bacterium]